MDLIIKNGLVVTPTKAVVTDIGINEGKIVAIGDHLGDADEIIDATNKIITPGMIDAHVHISQPGRTQWEGYISGTSAAVAGGVTSFLEMPLNQLPCTENVESLKVKVESGTGQLKNDVYLISALTPNNRMDIEAMNQQGVVSYKAFMTKCGDYSLPNDMHHVEDFDLFFGMKAIAKTGKVLMIHAENDSLVQSLTQLAIENNVDNYIGFEKYRSDIVELEAINRVIFFAKETGCSVHICHVSSEKAIALIKQAKNDGVDITCETTTHYLALDVTSANDIGTFAKCAPPIRSEANRHKLWEHLMNGDIDMVVSDHSPCTIDLKDKPFMEAWGGIAGLQNVYDIYFSLAYHDYKMDIVELVNRVSLNVAKRFNLRNKGSIELGKDADLVIIDPNKSYNIREENYYYKNRFSAYTGMKVNCTIEKTILRGKVVYCHQLGVAPSFEGKFKFV